MESNSQTIPRVPIPNLALYQLNWWQNTCCRSKRSWELQTKLKSSKLRKQRTLMSCSRWHYPRDIIHRRLWRLSFSRNHLSENSIRAHPHNGWRFQQTSAFSRLRPLVSHPRSCNWSLGSLLSCRCCRLIFRNHTSRISSKQCLGLRTHLRSWDPKPRTARSKTLHPYLRRARKAFLSRRKLAYQPQCWSALLRILCHPFWNRFMAQRLPGHLLGMHNIDCWQRTEACHTAHNSRYLDRSRRSMCLHPCL